MTPFPRRRWPEVAVSVVMMLVAATLALSSEAWGWRIFYEGCALGWAFNLGALVWKP